MASVRELVEGVEAVMPRLLIVKDAERDVLPTSLIALDTSQAIDIVLPPRWAWEGHLVEADDCAVIATAVREDLLRRHQRNQRWKNIDRLVLRIRRARQGDAAWRSGRPEFQAGPAFMPSPSRPPVESLAKVRLGTRTIDLGVGNDRYEEPLGGNRSVLLVFQEGLWIHPVGVRIRIGGDVHREPTDLSKAGTFQIERRRWWGRSDVLLQGEVIALHGSTTAAVIPTRWSLTGAVDTWLDEENPEVVVDGGLMLRAESNRLVLHNRGKHPVHGFGQLGEFRIDRGFLAEALPGEVDQVRMGTAEVSIAADSGPVSRETEELVLVPGGVGGDRQGMRRLLPLQGWATWTHLGELLRGPGVSAWFRPLLPCRVDGRETRMRELLPVRGSMAVQISPFGSLHIAA